MEHRAKYRIYWDAPLIAFVLVMVSAAAITAHGTWTFYRFILPEELAIAATIVLTAGIPLLELAAVLDRAGRARYLGGMVVLLGMEAFAQYLNAQAYFAANVRAHFPNPEGIDIATFVEQPAGRILPIVYLATLSAVVVYFGYAASARIRDLRKQYLAAAQQQDTLSSLRTQLAHIQAELAQARAESEHLQGELAQQQALSVEEVRSQTELSAQLRTTLDALQAELAQRDERLACQAAEIDELRTHAALPMERGDLDLVALARALREPRAIPWRDIEALLGVAQSTVRGWLKASENGHLLEA